MTAPTSDSPQPETRSRLAFWCWSWRGWLIFWAAFLSFYFLSAPPVEYLVMSSSDPRPYIQGLNMTYAPANWCAGNSKILFSIWTWEKSALRAMFGSPYQRRTARNHADSSD